MIKKIICLFTKHKFNLSPVCPFTGKAYDICQRCGLTIPHILV